MTQQPVLCYALIAAFAVGGCAHGGAFSTHETRWADHSPHRVLYVQVPGPPGNGARLQVLDWGGHGDVLLLLPGAEQTAHIFDDFAPRFTDRFHVIGLTRRGQPPSTASADSGYTIAGWADDIRAVLDSLHVARADIAGHSMAGAEMTYLAVHHPERVHKLVYLDATYDYAGLGTLPKPPIQRPTPSDTTLTSYIEWLKTVRYGFWTPAMESDVREGVALGDPKGVTDAIRDMQTHPNEYAKVQAPVLAFVSRPTVRTSAPWLDAVRDSASIRVAKTYLETVSIPWNRRGPDRLHRELPQARIIELESPHHIFIARQDVVVREMRAFLLAP